MFTGLGKRQRDDYDPYQDLHTFLRENNQLDDETKKLLYQAMFTDLVRSQRDEAAIRMIHDRKVVVDEDLIIQVVKENNLHVFKQILQVVKEDKLVIFKYSYPDYNEASFTYLQYECLKQAFDSNSNFIINYLLPIKSIAADWSHELLAEACEANRPQMLSVLLDKGYTIMKPLSPPEDSLVEAVHQFSLRATLLETALIGKDDRSKLMFTLLQSSIMENRFHHHKYLFLFLNETAFMESEVTEYNLYYLFLLIPAMVYTTSILKSMVELKMYCCVRLIFGCLPGGKLSIQDFASILSLLCENNRPEEIMMLMEYMNWSKLPEFSYLRRNILDYLRDPEFNSRRADELDFLKRTILRCIKNAIREKEDHKALIKVLVDYDMLKYIHQGNIFELVGIPRNFKGQPIFERMRPVPDRNFVAALRAFTDIDVDRFELQDIIDRKMWDSFVYIMIHISDYAFGRLNFEYLRSATAGTPFYKYLTQPTAPATRQIAREIRDELNGTNLAHHVFNREQGISRDDNNNQRTHLRRKQQQQHVLLPKSRLLVGFLDKTKMQISNNQT